jgi:hypothetical protein
MFAFENGKLTFCNYYKSDKYNFRYKWSLKGTSILTNTVKQSICYNTPLTQHQRTIFQKDATQAVIQSRLALTTKAKLQLKSAASSAITLVICSLKGCNTVKNNLLGCLLAAKSKHV